MGDLLQRLRDRFGTLANAARASGIKSSAMGAWCQGRRTPRPRSLELLRGALEGDTVTAREARIVEYAGRVKRTGTVFGPPTPPRSLDWLLAQVGDSSHPSEILSTST